MLVNYCLRKKVTTWGTPNRRTPQLAEVPQMASTGRFPHDAPPDAIELARADANGHGLLDAQLEAAGKPWFMVQDVAINLDFLLYHIRSSKKIDAERATFWTCRFPEMCRFLLVSICFDMKFEMLKVQSHRTLATLQVNLLFYVHGYRLDRFECATLAPSDLAQACTRCTTTCTTWSSEYTTPCPRWGAPFGLLPVGLEIGNILYNGWLTGAISLERTLHLKKR